MQYMTRHKWHSCNKFGITDPFLCRADSTRWFTYSKHRCHAHIPILLMSTAVLPQHSILHLHTAVAHSSGIAPVGSFYCRKVAASDHSIWHTPPAIVALPLSAVHAPRFERTAVHASSARMRKIFITDISPLCHILEFSER